MNATKRGATRGKKTPAQKEAPIIPAQALEILQSALHYCQRAGLTVNLDTTPEGLVLTLPGAVHEMTSEGVCLALVES